MTEPQRDVAPGGPRKPETLLFCLACVMDWFASGGPRRRGPHGLRDRGMPPAARFLSRERNRGKSAAGLRHCTPVRRALKRRGRWRGEEQAGAGRKSAVSDGAAGKAQWLFRVLVCRSAMFSVPLPRFPNRSLCFGLERRNDRTLASDRGPYADRIPRTSNRSGCFDLKRRSNRTHASIRGLFRKPRMRSP